MKKDSTYAEEKNLSPAEKGHAIKLFREQAGLSQEFVAGKAGYSLEDYIRIEEGLWEITRGKSDEILKLVYWETIKPLPFFERQLDYFNFKFICWVMRKQGFIAQDWTKQGDLFNKRQMLILIITPLVLLALSLLIRVFDYEIGYALGRTYRVIYQLVN